MNWIKTLPALLWLTALMLAGWVFGQLPLAAIAQSMAALSPMQCLAWVGLNLAIIMLATRRWWLLTKMLELPVGFYELLMVRQAGQSVSFITPGPQFGGEPLQIFWLWRRGERPIHSTLLALGLDRFYELWVNFGVLLIGALLLAASPAAETVNWLEAAVVLASILLMLFLLGWFILKRRDRVLAGLTQLTYRWRHHPRLQHIDTHWQRLGSDAEHVVSGQKPVLFRAFMLSLWGWVGLIAELWLLLSFFDLALDFQAFVIIMLSMRLAFLLPLPGGIGTLEASLFWAFQYLNLPTAAAIGLIALMRLRDALVLLVGLGCWRVMHVRK